MLLTDATVTEIGKKALWNEGWILQIVYNCAAIKMQFVFGFQMTENLWQTLKKKKKQLKAKVSTCNLPIEFYSSHRFSLFM